MACKIDVQRTNLIREKLIPNHQEPKNRTPIIYAMAGIPGSGKTTFVNKMLTMGQFPQDAYILNPDLVMDLLPEYHYDYNQIGTERAFKRWEMPSRSIAYQLFEEAVKLGIDIIQDMGSARWENYEMLKRLKEQHGYYLKMYWIDISIDISN